ncbi:MAG: c-type cytochrome [Burkholderiales bacterium]
MTAMPLPKLVPIFLAIAVLSAPLAVRAQATERSGKEVVEAVCAACHASGAKGAPKVGDRAAWVPRLKQGMDALALKAIRGHDGMPARGGAAALTDGEIKAAINYMFNPASAEAKAGATPAPAPTQDPAHKLIAGVDVYLGVLPAEMMRTRHAGAEGKMKQKVPSGKDYYYVSVVLRDHGSKVEIKDAKVEARVANLMTGETRKLEAATVNNALSYSNYFKMAGKDPYTVTLKIRKPGAATPIEAKFDVKH